jgi:hypothetical protein
MHKGGLMNRVYNVHVQLNYNSTTAIFLSEDEANEFIDDVVYTYNKEAHYPLKQVNKPTYTRYYIHENTYSLVTLQAQQTADRTADEQRDVIYIYTLLTAPKR